MSSNQLGKKLLHLRFEKSCKTSLFCLKVPTEGEVFFSGCDPEAESLKAAFASAAALSVETTSVHPTAC